MEKTGNLWVEIQFNQTTKEILILTIMMMMMMMMIIIMQNKLHTIQFFLPPDDPLCT